MSSPRTRRSSLLVRLYLCCESTRSPTDHGVSGPAVVFVHSKPDPLAGIVTIPQWPGSGGPSLDLTPLLQKGPGKVTLVTEVTIVDIGSGEHGV